VHLGQGDAHEARLVQDREDILPFGGGRIE
jgi:hypothetical protein